MKLKIVVLAISLETVCCEGQDDCPAEHVVHVILRTVRGQRRLYQCRRKKATLTSTVLTALETWTDWLKTLKRSVQLNQKIPQLGTRADATTVIRAAVVAEL